MPKLNLSFSDYDGDLNVGKFEPVPKGIYEVTIDASWSDEIRTSQNGTQYISLCFVINDGEYANRKIFDNFMIEGKGIWKLGKLLVAIDMLDPANPSDVRVDTRDLHGKVLKVRVDQREYNGEIKNEIKDFLPLSAKDPSNNIRKGKLAF